LTWSRERVSYFLLGLGLGALLDSFVFHQLLQWHHLWSRRVSDTTLAGLETNTRADGILDIAALAVVVLALALVAGRRVEPRALLGLGLVGWGVFQVVDHAVFHLALRAHHIREGVSNPLVYDWIFLGLGVALVAAGLLVVGRPREARTLS
jgi:uncharacterized membrane protein